jgi:hypothetical protein
MKSSQQTKRAVSEAEQGDDVELDRPIWFLGKELKDKPAGAKYETTAHKPLKPPKSVKSGKPSEAAPEEQPELDEIPPAERRPSQLEAYMRYAKMREPREDDSLAPVGSRRFPSGRHDGANENDIDWDDDTPRRRPQRHVSRGFRLRDAVFAGIASIAVGAVGGAVIYDRANDGALSQSVSDSVGQFLTGLNLQSNAVAAANADAVVPESRSTPASFKKPVTTARLDVNDAKGDVNSPIPLSISAEPAVPDQVIAVRLSGLPADAYLTAGTKLANNAWLLKPDEATGVKLMVPKAETSSLLIAVEAIEPRTGDLAAPTEEINVALNTAGKSQVLPTSAPATDAVKRNFNLPSAAQPGNAAAQPQLGAAATAQPGQGTPAQPGLSAAAPSVAPAVESDKRPSIADSASLMRNGGKLFDVGDFTAARAFFSRARDLGDREASLRLGQTYDPVVFRDRNVQGLKPDPRMALKYYLEARTAGIENADNAITGLESWLKQ